MFICNKCGNIIEEEAYLPRCHQREEVWGHIEEWVEMDCCPCGGTYEEAHECKICGNVCLDSICEDCLTFENAIDYGSDNKETVSINGFLAYEFSDKEIEEILMKHLIESKSLGKEPHYAEYIKEIM